MKITRISVEFILDEGTAVDEFLSRLTGTASPVTIEQTPSRRLANAAVVMGSAMSIEHHPAPQGSQEPATDPAPSRRRRTSSPANPTDGAAEAAPSAPAAPSASADTGSRRRRASSPPPPAPDPMPINDAEMSKAASNTAEVLVNMGEDGPGMVTLILEDFGVKSAGDIPVDQRQKFLDECAKEIRLAKEEKEMAP